MADKQTTTYQVKFEWLFQDGDTRTLTMDNPKATITAAEVGELETLILNAESQGDSLSGVPLLVGDKANSDFRRINLVVKETKTVIDIDLGL